MARIMAVLAYLWGLLVERGVNLAGTVLGAGMSLEIFHRDAEKKRDELVSAALQYESIFLAFVDLWRDVGEGGLRFHADVNVDDRVEFEVGYLGDFFLHIKVGAFEVWWPEPVGPDADPVTVDGAQVSTATGSA